MRTDVEQARPSVRTSVHGEIQMAEGLVNQGEVVRAMCAGQYAGGVALVVVTNQRLYLHRASKRMPLFREWPLSDIDDVAFKSGFTAGTLTFTSFGIQETVKSMPKKDAPRVVELLQSTRESQDRE